VTLAFVSRKVPRQCSWLAVSTRLSHRGVDSGPSGLRVILVTGAGLADHKALMKAVGSFQLRRASFHVSLIGSKKNL